MADTVQITMPQMGESVSEGTILTWHKQEGDWVDKDETIVEVSTDKVDAEVPAPQAGKLVKILAQEDETVEVGQALAELEPGEAPAGDGAAPKKEPTTVTAESGNGGAAAAAGSHRDRPTPPAVGRHAQHPGRAPRRRRARHRPGAGERQRHRRQGRERGRARAHRPQRRRRSHRGTARGRAGTEPKPPRSAAPTRCSRAT